MSKTVTSIRFDEQTRGELAAIASHLKASPSEAIRIVIRDRARRIKRTARTDDTLSGVRQSGRDNVGDAVAPSTVEIIPDER